jgi:hypothetical protein
MKKTLGGHHIDDFFFFGTKFKDGEHWVIFSQHLVSRGKEELLKITKKWR